MTVFDVASEDDVLSMCDNFFRAHFNVKNTILSVSENPVFVETCSSTDLITMMEFPTLVRCHLYIEMNPWYPVFVETCSSTDLIINRSYQWSDITLERNCHHVDEIFLTAGVVREENFVKMLTFLFQYMLGLHINGLVQDCSKQDCVSNGVTAVLPWAIDMPTDSIKTVDQNRSWLCLGARPLGTLMLALLWVLWKIILHCVHIKL